ncbi:MAG: hypothetical protein PUP93_34515, partial [Rhizonema sp. NSF051]|nr:hypothetical protein [Rhizonema sp. NSF051]
GGVLQLFKVNRTDMISMIKIWIAEYWNCRLNPDGLPKWLSSNSRSSGGQPEIENLLWNT